jgi:DNA-binding MarR family transcriptional regulator
VTGAERAARDRVLRDAGDELAGLFLDDLLPVADRLRTETARRLGITPSELACLETLRRLGPLSSDVLGHRIGLSRSAVSKLVRRLEQAGHVERSGSSSHLQAIVVRLRAHEVRDDLLDLLRFRLAAALAGAAAEAGLDRRRRLAGVVTVLRVVSGCLHEAASDAAAVREARQMREGKRW